MDRGFTLIELLVVTFIISLFTALVLPNYRTSDQHLSLQRAAYKLAQDIRRTQELALSSQGFSSQVPAGYGVYFNENQPAQYILFADLDGDLQYSGSSEKMEEIILERGVLINNLLPRLASALTISFAPPDPTVTFYPDAAEALIVIAIETVAGATKTIQVNKAGLIAVE